MSATGGCLCGGVRYRVRGALRSAVACHCSQCRRWTGSYVMATAARSEELEITHEATLGWFASSEAAERGFCTRCGSSLFWRRTEGARTHTSISAGTLDPPTGITLARHIFVADKSDYYTLADGLPQHPAWPE